MLPARYVFAVYGFLGITCMNAMRAILSVSIIAMVNSPEEILASSSLEDGICVKEEHQGQMNETQLNITNDTDPGQAPNWDVRTQSIILSSFYYGYTVFLLPGGVAAQRFGGKLPFVIALLLSSVLTLATPRAAEHGALSVIVLRVLLGAIQSPALPSMNLLISQWAPVKEMSTILAVIYSGISGGIFSGIFLGGLLSGTPFLGGWPLTFYVFGAAGILLSILCFFFVYETPSQHPRISEAELLVIQESKTTSADQASTVPWRSILTSVPVWSMLAGSFGYGWMLYFYMTELPTYLFNVFHFDIKTDGLLSALPQVIQTISSIIASYVADTIRRKEITSITVIRKTMNSIAAFGLGGCSLLVAFAGCRYNLSVALIFFGMFLNGFCVPGIDAATVDMSPRFTGVLCGMANVLINLAGIVVPMVTGELTRAGQQLENWSVVFKIAAATSFGCGIIFDLFGKVDVQEWDQQRREETAPSKENTKDAI